MRIQRNTFLPIGSTTCVSGREITVMSEAAPAAEGIYTRWIVLSAYVATRLKVLGIYHSRRPEINLLCGKKGIPGSFFSDDRHNDSRLPISIPPLNQGETVSLLVVNTSAECLIIEGGLYVELIEEDQWRQSNA